MALSKRQLEKLRKVVRLHVNWFVASILGDDALSADERKELEGFKKLPKKSLNLVEKSFILGRMKAILKKKEWKDLTWADLDEVVKAQKLSGLERLVLQQAELSAAQHIKGLADDITAGVFDQLARATNQAISEASLKEMVKDEVKLAVLERKSYKELASKLASTTKTKFGRDWKKISRTELHSAKIAGTAQAIINRVDVYKHSRGIESKVSIVPSPGTCPDCAKHYLDKQGNPKVFPLSKLMGAGSNADPGVSHKRKGKIHLNWKTTLPPLHPNCCCQLVYIPPGYAWVDGKLKVTDREALQKAIGDSKLSPVKKPQGPESAQNNDLPAPPSIPGQASPAQQTPTPGATSGKGPTGPEVDYVPKEKSPKRPPGAIGETENSWKVIPGAQPGKPLTPEQERAKKKEQISEAKAFNREDHPHRKVLDHISDGDIALQEPLGEDEKGVTESYRVTIAGNGQAMMKPAMEYNPRTTMGDGFGTAPAGSGAKREAAAYSFTMALGMEDHIPPTVTRVVNGQEVSMQQWKEGYSPAHSIEGGLLEALDKIGDPEVKAKAMQKLHEVAALGLIMNHNDQHFGNILYNPDTHDIMAIDNTNAFGHGMHGTKSQLARDMHKRGMLVKIPDHMQEKLRKTTMGDLKRSMGEHLSDVEIGQHYMRMQYMLYLQDTEGHLDFDKMRGVMLKKDKRTGEWDTRARPGMWGKADAQEVQDILDDHMREQMRVRMQMETDTTITDAQVEEHIKKLQADGDEDFAKEALEMHAEIKFALESQHDPEFLKRKEDKTLPNDLFESFAKQWIMDAKALNDPRGQQIDDLGIFMPPGSMMNDMKQTRQKRKGKEGLAIPGKHREYEKTIEPRVPNKALPAGRKGSGAGKPKGATPMREGAHGRRPDVRKIQDDIATQKQSESAQKRGEAEGKAEAKKLQAMSPSELREYRGKQLDQGERIRQDRLQAEKKRRKQREERDRKKEKQDDLGTAAGAGARRRKAGQGGGLKLSLYVSGEKLQKAFPLDTGTPDP